MLRPTTHQRVPQITDPMLTRYLTCAKVRGVELRVIDHPLVAHKLTLLRDITTDSPTFRRLVDELVMLLAYEATEQVRVEPFEIETPIQKTTGVHLSKPRPLVVPILRAGLGMLEGFSRLMPSAEVGFVGMVRDEETLEPFTYAERLPADLHGRQCYVLDPMLATGGSLAGTVQFLVNRGADHITCICLSPRPRASSGCASSWTGSACPAPSWWRPSTSASTRSATSSRAWVTRATVCTDSPSRSRAPAPVISSLGNRQRDAESASQPFSISAAIVGGTR